MKNTKGKESLLLSLESHGIASFSPDLFPCFMPYGINFEWCFVYVLALDSTDPSRHQHRIIEGATLSQHWETRTNKGTTEVIMCRKVCGEIYQHGASMPGDSMDTEKVGICTEKTEEKGPV